MQNLGNRLTLRERKENKEMLSSLDSFDNFLFLNLHGRHMHVHFIILTLIKNASCVFIIIKNYDGTCTTKN